LKLQLGSTLLATSLVGKNIVANVTQGFPTGTFRLQLLDQSTPLESFEVTVLLPYFHTASAPIPVPASTHRYLFAVDIPLQYQYFQNISCFVNQRAGLTFINGASFGCDVILSPIWTRIDIDFLANKKDRSLLVASLSNYYKVFSWP